MSASPVSAVTDSRLSKRDHLARRVGEFGPDPARIRVLQEPGLGNLPSVRRNLAGVPHVEVPVNKAILFVVVVLVLFLLFAPVALAADEQSDAQRIIVKNTDVVNGVVIVTVQTAKAALELQCNKGLAGCTVLEPGEYMMVRLPKNRGLYDCANAEVHRKSASSEPGDQVGQYCLVEKR